MGQEKISVCTPGRGWFLTGHLGKRGPGHGLRSGNYTIFPSPGTFPMLRCELWPGSGWGNHCSLTVLEWLSPPPHRVPTATSSASQPGPGISRMSL